MKPIAIILFISAFLLPKLSFAQFTFKDKLKPNAFGIHRTVFLYRDSDLPKKDSLEAFLNRNWKLKEKLQLMSYDEYKPLAGDIVFRMGGLFYQTFSSPTYSNTAGSISTGKKLTSGGVPSNFIDFRLDLVYYPTEAFSDGVASARLFMGKSIAIDIYGKKLPMDTVIRNAYKSGVIYNWDYAYISSFVSMCSEFLQNKQKEFSPKAPETTIEELKTSTLYISDAVNLKFRILTGKIVHVKRSKRVKARYKLDCQIIDSTGINKLALEKEAGFVMYFIQVMHGRYIVVLDIKTGMVVYETMGKRHRFNFNISDMARIREAVLKPTE